MIKYVLLLIGGAIAVMLAFAALQNANVAAHHVAMRLAFASTADGSGGCMIPCCKPLRSGRNANAMGLQPILSLGEYCETYSQVNR